MAGCALGADSGSSPCSGPACHAGPKREGGAEAGRAASCASAVPPRLESPALDRLVRISAKPSKLLREALQPVLAKHGLSPQQVELRRVSRGRSPQSREQVGWGGLPAVGRTLESASTCLCSQVRRNRWTSRIW